MAIYFLNIASVGRSDGRTATAAAAYRSGERIHDERSGRHFDHSDRQDVVHKEILLPAGLGVGAASWARDRAQLWNAAEHAEHRSNSRVAREFQVALPPELSAEQRLGLARAFSRQIADRYQVAVDLAIHDPKSTGDPRNFHAHLLATTRAVTAKGLGAKVGLDAASVRTRSGLRQLGRTEFLAVRERWAILTNEALFAARSNARVDHRTLEAQGIEREPRARIPWGAYRQEQLGAKSEVAERVRERYRQRVQLRREKFAAQQLETSRARSDTSAIRKAAREQWAASRAQSRARTQSPENVQDIARTSDKEASKALERERLGVAAVDRDHAL